jgi:hypothetical protein
MFKALLLFFILAIFISATANAQTTFELEPSQSMIMTGKGPGQDATINPFYGQDCYAIVKNIGERKFTVRIQTKGETISEITVPKGETKKIKLLKSQELYLDPNPDGVAKASVDYEPLTEK